MTHDETAIEVSSDSDLPDGFAYPPEFLRALDDLGCTNFGPWWILTGTLLRSRMEGLRTRYPARSLVPFARRQDNDDVACWDLDQNNRVVVVHDFASPGWERRAEYDDFNSWLRQTTEDLIDFIS